jgi:hypothetical protein
MILAANRCPPRIKSGAGFRRIMRLERSRPPGVAPQSIRYVRCIMSARITPKDGLPRFDPVELAMLLLGVAALTLVAVVL